MKFYLIDNPLTPDPKDFRAVVTGGVKRTKKDVVKMIQHRNVGLTESQINSVLTEEQAAIRLFLEQGDTVSTDLFTVRPQIKGVFNSKAEPFTPGKHQVVLKMTANGTLSQAARQIVVEQVAPVKSVPLLATFVDYATDTHNEVATPGQAARIYGDRLKFDRDDENQGIFFINDKGVETKVTTIMDNLPKKLSFNIPDKLAAGTYKVVVRSNIRMKDTRTGELEELLTVA